MLLRARRRDPRRPRRLGARQRAEPPARGHRPVACPRAPTSIIQVHYHPSGKPETDRSRIGLYFARKPVTQTLHWNLAANLDLKLPPGESNIEVKAAWPVPVDVERLRRHARTCTCSASDMLMTVTFPDGRTQDLIKIDDWDFNWQNTYYFEKPIDLPKGSVVKVVAHFDNSADNPRNPNKPPKDVKWGEATTDEMCIGFIAVTKKGQDLTRPGEKDDLQRRSSTSRSTKDRKRPEKSRQ